MGQSAGKKRTVLGWGYKQAIYSYGVQIGCLPLWSGVQKGPVLGWDPNRLQADVGVCFLHFYDFFSYNKPGKSTSTCT